MQYVDSEDTDTAEEESLIATEESPPSSPQNKTNAKWNSINVNSIAVEDLEEKLSTCESNEEVIIKDSNGNKEIESTVNGNFSNAISNNSSIDNSSYKAFSKIMNAKLATYKGRKFADDDEKNTRYTAEDLLLLKEINVF